MMPPTSLLQSLTSPLWHLVVLGAVHRSDCRIGHAFPALWESHASSSMSDLRAAGEILEAQFHLGPSVTTALFSDWTHRTELALPTSEELVFLAIGVAAFGRRVVAATTEDQKAVVTSASRCQLSMLLEGALVGRCWAETHAKMGTVHTDSFLQLLRHADNIGGNSSRLSHSTMLRDVAALWLRAEPWTTTGYSPEFQTDLRCWMRSFAEMSHERVT